ncbi:hypothetical protein [Streptomyces sp. MST-110588]|uniref:hypothetical protein n=1 Tax=Streptomyces sp. MST-110588 TaxID=2833628 RepID=UPI001F5D296E|nr:hypothetical protein [Streptomyces sp. MST-110588]UNO41157.1 hypothetical protein KGS77_18160 [Streptomyces sp. MST-110588]
MKGTRNPSVPPGLRISRVPGEPVRREADGRYAIHLWLRQDGKFDGDITLQLTPAETELLHAQLCFALDEDPAEPVSLPADRTPDCRKPVPRRPVVRWP